jgi:type VI secretion system secreted protein Hcp
MAEMFLKLDGIIGESQDSATPKAHQGEIEIKSWSWVTTNVVKWDVNQGGQSTKVEVKDIRIDKMCDSATVALYQNCVTGKHIKNATITCRKNDGEQKVEYLIVELTDIMISKVEWQGEGSDQSVKEQVDLSFAEFHLNYKVQKDEGNVAGGTEFGFNIQKQQKA